MNKTDEFQRKFQQRRLNEGRFLHKLKTYAFRLGQPAIKQLYALYFLFKAPTTPKRSKMIIVGALVGLVGAGGGFLIIPALVMLAKLPMKKAIGTSLAIVALNSTIGFLSDFGTHEFNWSFLFMFTGFAVVGIIIGSYLSKYISGAKLKPAFGWFILIMGTYIISKELFFPGY